MTITIREERPDGADASQLINELQALLEPLYPPESRHGYPIEKLLQEKVAFFVIRVDDLPAGCGAIKLFGSVYGEVKRMYVRPQFRGQGLGKRMLEQLESYAQERGLSLLRLETGIYQTEAIALYEKYGFKQIPPFGPYREDPLSRCYEKAIV
jgi:putative acetyltransferase